MAAGGPPRCARRGRGGRSWALWRSSARLYGCRRSWSGCGAGPPHLRAAGRACGRGAVGGTGSSVSEPDDAGRRLVLLRGGQAGRSGRGQRSAWQHMQHGEQGHLVRLYLACLPSHLAPPHPARAPSAAPPNGGPGFAGLERGRPGGDVRLLPGQAAAGAGAGACRGSGAAPTGPAQPADRRTQPRAASRPRLPALSQPPQATLKDGNTQRVTALGGRKAAPPAAGGRRWRQEGRPAAHICRTPAEHHTPPTAACRDEASLPGRAPSSSAGAAGARAARRR